MGCFLELVPPTDHNREKGGVKTRLHPLIISNLEAAALSETASALGCSAIETGGGILGPGSRKFVNLARIARADS